MAARTLYTAIDLRVFTQLAAEPLPLPQIAEALGLAERAAGRLLYACAALGLVQVTPAGFANTPLTQQYLVEGKPTFIGSYLTLFDTLAYHRWEQLGLALHRNGPVDAVQHPYYALADDADEASSFSMAQHDGSRSLGYALARRVDFTPYTCLLDLGGGSGAYTVEILRHYPHLRAILMDFPQVARLAETVMQQEGLTERVQILGGDYEREALPSGADVVLWSGNLHASSPERCLHVLTKLRAVLPPTGLVVLHDYVLDADRTGPLIPALLALHLTLVSAQGQVYSRTELRALLTQAGFATVDIQAFLPGHSSLVMAQVR
jgi:SAM-dependent methyltransferase